MSEVDDPPLCPLCQERVTAAEAAANPPCYTDDVLKGMREIAEYRGETLRQTHYALERGLVPGQFKVGGKWFARKSAHDRQGL